MYDADLYNLTQSLGGAFFTAVGPLRAQEELDPLPDLLRLRAGYAESPGWFLVQALEFDPQPLTAANLRVRDIYASNSLVTALLEIMASEKWLVRRDQRYFLSPLGRELALERQGRMVRWLSALEPDLDNEIQQIEHALAHIIRASLSLGTPPGDWCLRHSRSRAPAGDAPATVKVYHYTADFNAFRDDAHMAAWSPLGLDGRTWEAFSLISDGRASSAGQLFQQLAYRGYCEQDYAAALHDLKDRGWIEPQSPSHQPAGEHYRTSSQGQVVRDNVESLTNDYFFAPWRSLGREQISNIIEGIQRLIQTLQALGS